MRSDDREGAPDPLAAGKGVFGERSAGSPFTVYAFTEAGVAVRNYAVEAGEHLEDSWRLADFADGQYRLRAYGPNGFYREFVGRGDSPVKPRFNYVPTPGGRSLAGASRSRCPTAGRPRARRN